MPLFMDLHKAEDYDVRPTVDEIKKNHIADLQVQHKYGVKFLQYWINEEAGMVFCLMEAPDKESCAAVHREAHGAMPCNIIELKGGDYQRYMGNEGRVNEFDIVEKTDGALDTGYRFIMAMDVILTKPNEQLSTWLHQIIKKHAGRTVIDLGGRQIAAFSEGSPAILCARELVKLIKEKNTGEIRIGVSTAQPVTAHQEIFGKGRELAGWLCDIAQNQQVVVSSLTKQLGVSLPSSTLNNEQVVKVMNAAEEQFLHQLMHTLSMPAFGASFAIDDLCSQMNLSRSGLYRKITSLTGLSANSFIQELRLQKAYKLFIRKQGNVTEVAYESGFSSGSYFTRSFQRRFGTSPLQLLKLIN